MTAIVKVDWQDQRVKSRVRSGSVAAAKAAADMILAHANKTVPKDTGRLKDSGRVHPYALPSGGGTATVSYNTPYAARLHENPQYNFRGRGRGKWLQLAVQETAMRVARVMAETLAGYVRG